MASQLPLPPAALRRLSYDPTAPRYLPRSYAAFTVAIFPLSVFLNSASTVIVLFNNRLHKLCSSDGTAD